MTKAAPPRPAPARPAEPWIVRHWQQTLLALGAACAAALLSAVVVSKLKKADERAWEQFSFALSQASQGRAAEAMKGLDDLLSSRRSGPVAVQAYLMRSDLLLAQGRADDALAALRDARRQAASPEYKALVAMAMAHALEETGRPAEAAEEYAAFLRDHPDHFLVPRATEQLGRLQAALGKTAEAKATYEKLITLYPSTLWAKNAKAALEDIHRQAPPR